MCVSVSGERSGRGLHAERMAQGPACSSQPARRRLQVSLMHGLPEFWGCSTLCTGAAELAHTRRALCVGPQISHYRGCLCLRMLVMCGVQQSKGYRCMHQEGCQRAEDKV